MQSRRPIGLAFALTSAGSFALSGIFASALLDGGWSAGAVTLVRISGGALVLLGPTLRLLRGRWDAVLRSWREVLVLGVLAVAVCQLAFFSAVAYIDPSLALLIEFLGPVLLVFFTWATTRRAPAMLTLAGAAAALVGLGLAEPVVLTGATMPWWSAMGMLILIATASSYVLGILGARRLGATLASFVGYSEPMFGILWTALLLSILPSGMQWLGAGAIIAGVLLVRLGQVGRPKPTRGPSIVEGIPSP